MKKLIFFLLFTANFLFSFGQDTASEKVARPDFSQEAIKYYFKSSESSHLSSKEQSWSFSYMSLDKKKLQLLADELNKVAIKPAAIEKREGNYIFTLKEKKKYNPESLFLRIQELNKIGASFGIGSITSFYVDTL